MVALFVSTMFFFMSIIKSTINNAISMVALIALLLSVNTLTFADENKNINEERVSADRASANAVISSNGRYVAFHSAASNFVPNDNNNQQDIFVYDREKQTIERVSVATDGTEANNYSQFASISGDGRYVTFMSLANNLVEEKDENYQVDVFLHDRQTKTTKLVSKSLEGNAGNTKSLNPVISKNGGHIVFESFAHDLIENDDNENADVFVYTIENEAIELASITSDDKQANHGSSTPSISADGRFVVYHSAARNLVPEDNKRSDDSEWNFSDVFLRDRELNKTELISVNLESKPGNHPSFHASISGDGRYVAFTSMATDLVENYPQTSIYVGGKGRVARRVDIFVRDRETNKTRLVSATSDGTAGNHQSQAPKISTDGRYVSFQSAASNLVENAMPGVTINIYRKDLLENKMDVVTKFDGPKEANVMAAHSAVSSDGTMVVFDTNYGHRGAQLARESDVYLWNAETGKLELISFARIP